MSRLDRIKVVAKTDDKTVYQLNRKLLLKVVKHDGYYKTYLKVSNGYPEWSTAAQYKFIAITSSDEISNIFNEVDQLGIMSLQVSQLFKRETIYRGVVWRLIQYF